MSGIELAKSQHVIERAMTDEVKKLLQYLQANKGVVKLITLPDYIRVISIISETIRRGWVEPHEIKEHMVNGKQFLSTPMRLPDWPDKRNLRRWIGSNEWIWSHLRMGHLRKDSIKNRGKFWWL
jgi:hypothetical protein